MSKFSSPGGTDDGRSLNYLDEETKTSKPQKKKVTFSPDTYFSDEYNVFVNITNHDYIKEAGHTIYTIKVPLSQE